MLTDDIHSCGFDKVEIISTSEIPFDTSLIKLCEMNSCGNYGKNYTCPPYVGNTDDLIRKVRSYSRAAVFQKVYYIKDSFDIEGMQCGNNNFRSLVDKVYDVCKDSISNYLILGAGGCKRCTTCGVVEGVECRNPKKAFASIESHGIYVSKLAEVCGMKYINGQNSVTYFGMILF